MKVFHLAVSKCWLIKYCLFMGRSKTCYNFHVDKSEWEQHVYHRIWKVLHKTYNTDNKIQSLVKLERHNNTTIIKCLSIDTGAHKCLFESILLKTLLWLWIVMITIKVIFLYINVYVSVILDSLACLLTSISFFTILLMSFSQLTRGTGWLNELGSWIT